jgi:hypothetical protein
MAADCLSSSRPAAASWRFRYRFAGKENMLTFGTSLDARLSDARQKRDDARKFITRYRC